MVKPIIILGSARSFGNTYRAIKSIIGDRPIEIIDLNNFNITHYDYHNRNRNDDYLPLMERIILNHDLIVLATPVYWYTMSAQMKIFLDRLTDLLTIRKDLGRKLAHKKLFAIASWKSSVPKGFEDAFSQTCEYLEINYEGCSFIYSGRDVKLENENIISINKAHEIIFKR